MLVLTRKRLESVVVTVPPSTEPQTIVMHVVDIKGDAVRTGWNAHHSVSVHRAEIQRAIGAIELTDGAQEAPEGAGM